jgi:transposase-like protein
MATWTDELKEQVIKMYQDADPNPETSTEIIKDIADEIEMSPNGVRMVLVQAQVYVKKETAAGSKTTAKKEGDAPKRVSKESSIAELKAAIEAKGAAVDEDILGKLTGKAAVYFLSVIKA